MVIIAMVARVAHNRAKVGKLPEDPGSEHRFGSRRAVHGFDAPSDAVADFQDFVLTDDAGGKFVTLFACESENDVGTKIRFQDVEFRFVFERWKRRRVALHEKPDRAPRRAHFVERIEVGVAVFGRKQAVVAFIEQP